MTTDWRAHAEAREWGKISRWKLSDDDRDELIAILAPLVPRAVLGSGLDTFQDFLPSSKCPPGELQEAAELLERLRNYPNDGRPSYPKNWLERAFRRAVEVAGKEGLKLVDDEGAYRDLRDVFVFIDRDGWPVELRKDIAEAILEKDDNFFDGHSQNDFDALYPAYLAWRKKYPWRRVQSLWTVARMRWFGVNTPLDHALLLIMLCQEIHAHRMAGDDMGMDGFAFEAGRHFEALRWKQHEDAALRQYHIVEQNRKHGKKGGQGDKKKERYGVLNALAKANEKMFAFVSDQQALRNAKSLARKHDAHADPRLFADPQGRLLSDRWFKDWLSTYRTEKNFDYKSMI